MTDGFGVHVSCTDAAALIRAALKRDFPGTRFSVRCRTFSGGASIDVSWADGPAAGEVDMVVQLYAGTRFAWLYQDGRAEPFIVPTIHGADPAAFDNQGDRVSAVEAGNYIDGVRSVLGLATARGHDQASVAAYAAGHAEAAMRIAAGAELVHFAVDRIMIQRSLSPELQADLEGAVAFLGDAAVPFDSGTWYEFWIDGSAFADYGLVLVHRLADVDQKLVGAALQHEAERRAARALALFNEAAGDPKVGWFTVSLDDPRHGVLLGPFSDREVARAAVPAARALAEQACPQAVFHRLGVGKATRRNGEDLPMGHLETLPARQMALAGFEQRPGEAVHASEDLVAWLCDLARETVTA